MTSGVLTDGVLITYTKNDFWWPAAAVATPPRLWLRAQPRRAPGAGRVRAKRRQRVSNLVPSLFFNGDERDPRFDVTLYRDARTKRVRDGRFRAS